MITQLEYVNCRNKVRNLAKELNELDKENPMHLRRRVIIIRDLIKIRKRLLEAIKND